MNREELVKKPWWSYLETDLQELLLESVLLTKKVENWEEKFHDYAFIVFPASKSYEGFLKKVFLDLEFITRDDYFGKRFRIGKALNPSLDRNRYKGESIYDKLVNYCGGKELADYLWMTWKTCRNVLFHWYPNEKNAIGFEKAKQRVERVIISIDKTFEECEISV